MKTLAMISVLSCVFVAAGWGIYSRTYQEFPRTSRQSHEPTHERQIAKAHIRVQGTTFGWDGKTTNKLGSVKITIYRDDLAVTQTDSDSDGSFSLSIERGSPVVLTFSKSGYAEGKYVCSDASGDKSNLELTLLKGDYVREHWGTASAAKFFARLDSRRY